MEYFMPIIWSSLALMGAYKIWGLCEDIRKIRKMLESIEEE
jgi:hypothetical protein